MDEVYLYFSVDFIMQRYSLMASTIVELTDIFSQTVCSIANETILTNAVTLKNKVRNSFKNKVAEIILQVLCH